MHPLFLSIGFAIFSAIVGSAMRRVTRKAGASGGTAAREEGRYVFAVEGKPSVEVARRTWYFHRVLFWFSIVSWIGLTISMFVFFIDDLLLPGFRDIGGWFHGVPPRWLNHFAIYDGGAIVVSGVLTVIMSKWATRIRARELPNSTGMSEEGGKYYAVVKDTNGSSAERKEIAKKIYQRHSAINLAGIVLVLILVVSIVAFGINGIVHTNWSGLFHR